MQNINVDLVRQLIVVIIPVLTPLIIAGLKKLVSNIPPIALPILAPIVGVLIDAVAQAFGVTGVGMTGGALLGLSGVGVREVVDQAKKRNG